MPGKSQISWTQRTWNPTVGCTRVSRGCDACYAFALHDQRHEAWKSGRMPNAPKQYHEPFSTVQLMPDRLTVPMRWREPSLIFVNSVSDLFHADVPDEFIDRVFATMARCPQHTFQILTKRPQRMLRYLTWEGEHINRKGCIQNQLDWMKDAKGNSLPRVVPEWPLNNVWLGVSVEDQEVTHRIDLLVKTPAAIRFLSCEPLIGPLDLRPWLQPGAYGSGAIRSAVDWVICGGESGPHFRPMELDWARSLRDQCQAAGVAYFHKQGSGRLPGRDRKLDGRLWEEFPEVRCA